MSRLAPGCFCRWPPHGARNIRSALSVLKLSRRTAYSLTNYLTTSVGQSRSRWSRGLRRGTAAARLLRFWVRIPPRTWMSVCCECCVFSGRGSWYQLITRPEESYRLCEFLSVIYKPLKWGGPAPMGAVEPNLKSKHIWAYININHYINNDCFDIAVSFVQNTQTLIQTGWKWN